MADDIWIFDKEANKISNISNNKAQDIFPMWIDDKVYYISDRDKVMNLKFPLSDSSESGEREIELVASALKLVV